MNTNRDSDTPTTTTNSPGWSPWGPSWAGEGFLKVHRELIGRALDAGLDHRELIVLQLLVSRLEHGFTTVYMSSRQLEKEARLSRSTAQRVLRGLVARGWLEVVQPGGYSSSGGRAATFDLSGALQRLARDGKEDLDDVDDAFKGVWSLVRQPHWKTDSEPKDAALVRRKAFRLWRRIPDADRPRVLAAAEKYHKTYRTSSDRPQPILAFFSGGWRKWTRLEQAPASPPARSTAAPVRTSVASARTTTACAPARTSAPPNVQHIAAPPAPRPAPAPAPTATTVAAPPPPRPLPTSKETALEHEVVSILVKLTSEPDENVRRIVGRHSRRHVQPGASALKVARGLLGERTHLGLDWTYDWRELEKLVEAEKPTRAPVVPLAEESEPEPLWAAA